MSALYLYGVVGAKKPLQLSIDGLAGGVHVIAEGGLGAIAGSAPECGLQGLTREQAVRFLIKHQEALETAMTETTVLPVKFGVVAPSEAAVRRMLDQGADLLHARLEEFTGRHQMEIVVSWKLDRVFAEISREPEIARAQTAIQAGAGEAERAQFGLMVKAALDRRRSGLSEKLAAELKAVARDIAVNPLMDDSMVANFALLLETEDTTALEDALNRLDASFDGQMKFRCVGPLPPSSFATVEVSFPSRQAIDGARQTLNIEGAASRNEIVSAFRRLARENHPDATGAQNAAAQSPDAHDQSSARMGELSSAYRLLMAHVKAQAPDDNDTIQTVIIDVVRRQPPVLHATP